MTADQKRREIAGRIARAIVAAKARHEGERTGQPFTVGLAADVIATQLAIEYPAAAPANRRNAAGRDELFDAIAVACGVDLTCLTRQYSKQIAVAKRDILEATPTVTPEEVERRGEAYRKKYRDAACTPTALANHWPEFGTAPEARTRAAKNDIYIEPIDWKDRLRRISASWDRDIVEKMLNTRWVELSATIRQDILRA